MAVFTYQGLSIGGEHRTGEVEASSRSEALRRLSADRIQPLSLVSKAEAILGKSNRHLAAAETPRNSATGGLRLSQSQIILFTDELADFLHSGLQLEPALQLMENREERSPIKQVAAFLREKVRDGTSFSEALRLASPSFGDLYCNLVAAGEASGALAPLLRRQALHLAALQELKNHIQLSLIYPGFLVGMGIIAMSVFMIFLVPQMTTLFAKTGTTMPWSTYVLFQLGYVSQHYGLLILSVLGVLTALFITYIRQGAGRRWWDEAKLKIPLFGALLSASFYAQFCQMMANLLQNGLPLLTALKLMSRATGNVFFQVILVRLTDLVGEGASLTSAMKTVGHFPPNLRDLVKVGEQTGDLGSSLEKVGQRYEKIIQHQIDRIMSLIQPVIILALGGMVGLVAWSMLSGIYQAIHGLQGH